ncbi:MAG: C-GCAxxG-C-C family protein [Bacilli bacterium]|nr:C-GCAxxG-C-C family protein [Bacilli bacterium]
MLQELARKYYNECGKNCAEAILLAGNEVYNLGLKEEDADLVIGFGGGMGCGSLCGCLAASIAILGKLYKTRPDFRDVCARFVEVFKNGLACESIDCSAIASKYKTPERRCEEAVLVSSRLLEEFINGLK